MLTNVYGMFNMQQKKKHRLKPLDMLEMIKHKTKTLSSVDTTDIQNLYNRYYDNKYLQLIIRGLKSAQENNQSSNDDRNLVTTVIAEQLLWKTLTGQLIGGR